MHDPGEHDDELVMSLVEAAMARPPLERDAFLRSTCTRPDLYAEVRERVEWEERMGAFLCDPVIAPESAGVFAPGELVANRFRIVRELGRGGMGVVCEAQDEKLNRRVAIKTAQRGYTYRLSPEARAALEVSHPNVCKLHEIHTADTAGGQIDFLTMEFVEGETASARIKREGPLPEPEARRIALQVCAGLAQAHMQGVIHGDIKAANVILSNTAEGAPRAVLTDFGLARLHGTSQGPTQGSVDGGTPGYMAPELIRGGRATVATDIYALGAFFHLLLTGAMPDTASPVVLPVPWAGVVRRCLAAAPDERFASVSDLTDALTERKPLGRWLLAGAAVVIAVLSAALWFGQDASPDLVRLAVLPLTVQGEAIPTASGIGDDVAERVSGARRNFSVISPSEALRSQVDTAAKARSVLGATHVLSTRLRLVNGKIAVRATVEDAAGGQPVRELTGEYGTAPLLAKALIATVSRAFNLRAASMRETVSAAAYPYFVQASALLRRDTDSADEAMPLFRKAVELDPVSALPWAGLAEAQLQKYSNGAGDEWLHAAEESVAKARSINADAVPVLLASGVVAQRRGNYEQSLEDLTRATQLEPQNSEPWRRLAAGYAQTNRIPEAIATYRKAIQLQPTDYRHYQNLAGLYLRRNEYAQAEDLNRKVVQIAPTLAAGHMNLAIALMQQQKFREAEQSMLTSLRLRRTAPGLINLGALYYAQERYAEALKFFREGLAAAPPTALRYRNLGDACRHLGRDREAREAYLKARDLAEEQVARNPRQAAPRGLLALMLARLGETRRALSEVAQALAMEPGNAMVMRDAAMAFETLKQRDRTLQVLQTAPPDLLTELSRQPDVKELQRDERFRSMIVGKSK